MIKTMHQGKEEKSMSPLPPMEDSDDCCDDDNCDAPHNISLDLFSTASTDTESSLSACCDENDEERASPTPADVPSSSASDIESPFGKLRHRGELVTSVLHHNILPMDDSDSEHGLIPRSRRRRDSIDFKRFMFYGFSLFVGLCYIVSIRSSFGSGRETGQWKHYRNIKVPAVRKAFKSYKPENEYTIILHGSRLDLLQQSLDNFSRCPSVREIQVNYHDGRSNNNNNNSNNRELPITLFSRKVVPISEKTTTSAIFLLSEGVIIPCHEIEKAFNTWKRDPRQLLGFFGYKVPSDGTSGTLSSLQHIAPGTDSYAFVSNRAVFIHKLYLDSLPAVGGYKDERHHGNCCDVSLSLQVSVAFGKPPVVVKANIVDLVEGPDGVGHQIIGTCDDDCVPSWLEIADVHAIPHQHTAVLA